MIGRDALPRVTLVRSMVLVLVFVLGVQSLAAPEAPPPDTLMPDTPPPGAPPLEGPAVVRNLWGAVQECFRTIFAPLNRALAAIPMSTARWVAVAYIALGGLWTFLLPRRYIYEGAPSQARWRDLRLWAVVFLIPFALIYLLW